ncbi:transcription factor NIGT1-like [Panicum virgatum]|uniref:HTH myb-type domain-containing protein n=1 Tax=Panicum virgatum TaxID=38727 RepID=A0A8T0X1I1_PANVG|nr:transcription factor NIGT1-like [Panicum virgatum]KAG2649379.1 hypothetical protein PVAP13_1NG105900 [Panicum virgatum]
MDPPPRSERRRRREYLLALEEERRKIQVFQRELPLCLELVTQTIEGMRSQVDGGGGGGSEETVSDHGPVLEELMPLKPSLSLSSEEHESGAGAGKGEEAAETPPPPEARKQQATPDWLRSVQLWSQEPEQRPSSPSSPRKEPLCKPVALSARKAGGAFQPFERQKRAEAPASSATTAAASSAAAVVGDSSDGAPADTDAAERRPRSDDKETSGDAKDKGSGKKGSKGGEEGQSQAQAPARKPRRCWAPELHRRFLQALRQLGGSHVATPKQIRELMKVDGLTNDEVKSHLQKYRLHTRRPNATATVQSTGISASAAPAPPVPQFIVVGGIWVPPPEYAAAAAAQPAGGDASGMTTTTTAGTVYAPVATLPSGVQRAPQGPPRKSSGCSDGRRSGDASSGSPAVSSSSHTTSA